MDIESAYWRHSGRDDLYPISSQGIGDATPIVHSRKPSTGDTQFGKA